MRGPIHERSERIDGKQSGNPLRGLAAKPDCCGDRATIRCISTLSDPRSAKVSSFGPIARMDAPELSPERRPIEVHHDTHRELNRVKERYMLILTRRIGEEIRIGGDIRLIVLANKNGRVSLGIAAPASTPVMRSELLARAEQSGEMIGEQPRSESV
jgi:carbon storage regulator